MKKFIMLLLFLCLLAPIGQSAPAITITASAQSILGTTQTVSMTLTLIDPNQTGMLKAGSVVVTGFTATSSNGTTVSVGPIYGNDVITDGFGNANTSYYKVQIFPVTSGIIASTPALQNFYAFIGSGTIDISTATPLSPSFQSGTSGNVVLPGNLTVTGSATFGSIVYNNILSSCANPAQTGFIRMCTTDFIAWRNNANLADLALSKDVNDLLSWNGGAFKLTEVAAPGGVGNFDILWADSTAHRFKMNNNNGGADTVVGAATTDTFTNKTYNAQGTGNVFQIGGTTITNTGQSGTTFLRGDGTWTTPGAAVAGAVNLTAQQANCSTQTLTTPAANGYYRATSYLIISQAATSSSTTPTVAVNFTDGDTSSSQALNVNTSTSANTVNLIAGLATVQFFAKSGSAITLTCSGYASTGGTPMQYSLHSRLEGPF